MSSTSALSSPQTKTKSISPKRKPFAADGISKHDEAPTRALWSFPRYAISSAGLALAVAFFDYVLAFFVATRLVPVLMASVATGLGIDVSSATIAGLAVWVGASLTLIAFLLALSFVAMRAAWRARGVLLKRLGQRLRRA